jgi:branched-chain amino acid transport system permease protein
MMTRADLVKLGLLGLGVLGMLAVPVLGDNYLVRLCTFVAMYSAMALAWNLIGGYAGYPSFATAAFFGLGAYAGALLQNHGVPMVPAWIGATLVTAGFALAVGAMILRLRGHYFAVGSIALVEILRQVASTWREVTGGGNGLNVPILPGGPGFAGTVFLYAMLAIALLAFAATLWVDKGRLGFGLRCIRQNEDAANMVGIDADRYKTIAFTLSGLFCGTAGAAYASWVAYIDPSDTFNILTTLKVPVMVMLGGAGTLYGPLIGVLVFIALEETIWSSFLELHQAVLGTIIVILVFFLPGGLLKLRLPAALLPSGRR